MSVNNKLKKIDFTNGIRSVDIDNNFSTLTANISRERLRAAGCGIVEGFVLSHNATFTFQIGEGTLINDKGEELFIAASELNLDAPVVIAITETVSVDLQGQAVLKYRPYVNTKVGCLTDAWYQKNYPFDSQFVVLDASNVVDNIKIVSILDNTITLSASKWAGKSVQVNYHYTKDRMDSVLLNRTSGEYRIETGITSESPSMIDIVDYPTELAIGLARLTVGDEVVLTLEEGYRSLRKIYVNEHNTLYLNGKQYKEQPFVYFAEPSIKHEDDLWYDRDTNYLYIWRQVNGDWGWSIVNDASVIPYRVDYIFSPENNPTDLQTFRFPDDHPDLRFMPKTAALEIVIDNSPLMTDQYEEISETVGKDYLSVGIGFKLKDSLERATHVGVRVLHCVRTAPLRETFQRAAVFVNENYHYQNLTDTTRIYSTEVPYVIGENQLTVFLDGVRLEPGVDFAELNLDNSAVVAADRGKMSQSFTVIGTVYTGQRVSYRLERWVWSFDHLDQLVHEIEQTANDAKTEADAASTKVTTLEKNVDDRLDTLEKDVTQLQGSGLGTILTTSSSIGVENLSSNVREGLVSGPVYIVLNAIEVNTLEGLTASDYMVVYYQVVDTKVSSEVFDGGGASSTLADDSGLDGGNAKTVDNRHEDKSISRVLIFGDDYEVVTLNYKTTLTLSSHLVSYDTNLYVTGIHLGR